MGRILGVDYGMRKLGFAVSDPARFLSSSLYTKRVTNEGEALKAVVGAVEEQGAELIVLGLPLNMDGSSGPLAQAVQAFKEKLEKRTQVPIALWDERLTSKSAEDVLIQAGTRREKRKAVIDKLAAQIMLQHYLDSHEFP